MDEFAKITSGVVDEAFNDLTKITESWTEEQRQAHANDFGIRIWLVAGPSPDHAFAISVN